MTIEIIKNIIRFVLLVLLQVLVLNNIHLHGFISPYIYILFILLLPFETPPFVSLLVAFILGLAVDKFSNTAGIHASASVLLAFIRPLILAWLRPLDGYRPDDKPRLYIMGPSWFILYVLAATFIHHFYLFIIEAATFSGIYIMLLKTLTNGIISAILIFSTEALLGTRKAR